MLYRATLSALSLLVAWPLLVRGATLQSRANAIRWTSCGDGLQCANVSAPLDHNNASDTRTISLGVARFLATDQANRKGSVFINPGGPGGSATAWAVSSGDTLSAVLGGQHDIVGVDPRGVNLTKPYVSCFESILQELAWSQRPPNSFQFNIPSNISDFASSAEANLQYQVSLLNSEVSSLASHCLQRTGEALAYMGTAAVVKDIEYVSTLIDGEDAPVNFWGISYGTVVGQYLVKILPTNRVGKVIIDGVLNVDNWSSYPVDGYKNLDLGMAESLRGFASSCLAAKENCTLNLLNFTSSDELLNAIGKTVDSLYANPEPLYDLPYPVTVTAADVRFSLGEQMYTISRWPALAAGLALALTGNYSAVSSFVSEIDPDYAKIPDSGAYAQQIIFCDDTKAYDDSRPAPTTSELTQAILSHVNESPNWGSHWLSHLIFCHAWDKARLTPRRSRYNGTFELAEGTLATPVLILSNTVDNVTPLSGAKAALGRLGTNARLIQQKDAYGHTSISVVSFCTLRAIREYMLNGTAPSEAHSMCDVDQFPFMAPPVPPIFAKRALGSEEDAKSAWMQLSKTLSMFSFRP